MHYVPYRIITSILLLYTLLLTIFWTIVAIIVKLFSKKHFQNVRLYKSYGVTKILVSGLVTTTKLDHNNFIFHLNKFFDDAHASPISGLTSDSALASINGDQHNLRLVKEMNLRMLHSGLEELKIWVHVFSCTPIQVCVHVVHAANFVHVNYLCVHACTQIVYATVYVIMYFT